MRQGFKPLPDLGISSRVSIPLRGNVNCDVVVTYISLAVKCQKKYFQTTIEVGYSVT
ncbi:MAG: hypothetical protein ACRC62_32665 [Microcoleus sp.]